MARTKKEKKVEKTSKTDETPKESVKETKVEGKSTDEIEEKLKAETNVSQKQKDSTLIWIFAVMVLIIIGVLVGYFVGKGGQSFTYEGLKFTKEKFGEIPVFHYYYFYESEKGNLVQYNLYLRKDPRQNQIPVEGNIYYPKDKFVYISVNGTGLTQCEDSSLAVHTLAAFLTNNEIVVKGATPNFNETNGTNIRFANCQTHPNNVVILIQAGNTTRIYKEANTNGCHVIEVSDCQILDAIEKFEVQSVLDAKGNESEVSDTQNKPQSFYALNLTNTTN